jgi:Fe-S-cluster containining protein
MQNTKKEEKGRIIRSLRDSIPTVLCRHLCSDCCGCVPWSHYEWDLLPKHLKKGIVVNEVYVKPPVKGMPFRKMIIPTFKKLKGMSTIVMWDNKSWMELYTSKPISPNKCVFLSDGEFGCTVYQYRPIICRLFGTIMDDRAACKYGCHSIPRLHWKLGVAMTNGWFECMDLA